MRSHGVAGRLARRASLLALGALALHQLRYLLAYGENASTALARQGHSYLTDIGPTLVALALSVAFARLLAAALGRLAPERPSRALPREALAFAATLLAIFAAQELTEGVLSAGHPGGIAAVLGNGGWIALPLAVGIGLVIAVVDRTLAGAERTLAETGTKPGFGRLRPVSAALPGAPDLAAPAAGCLSFGLARRPPPAPLAS